MSKSALIKNNKLSLRMQKFSLRLNIQKQPSKGVLGKGVLKICSKFTGEHPC